MNVMGTEVAEEELMPPLSLSSIVAGAFPRRQLKSLKLALHNSRERDCGSQRLWFTET